MSDEGKGEDQPMKINRIGILIALFAVFAFAGYAVSVGTNNELKFFKN